MVNRRTSYYLRFTIYDSPAYGKEDFRLYQVAGAGGESESRAADWPGVGSAWREHHGILQGVQRKDRTDGSGHEDSGGHHGLRRSFVHVRNEDATGRGPFEEGGGNFERFRQAEQGKSRQDFTCED